MNRRGFLGSLLALMVAPKVAPKVVPSVSVTGPESLGYQYVVPLEWETGVITTMTTTNTDHALWLKAMNSRYDEAFQRDYPKRCVTDGTPMQRYLETK